MTESVLRWGGARLSRRMRRAVPVLGTVIAVATVGAAVRRKGFVRGLVDTGLNAMPWLGAIRIGVETLRGRDLIADRPALPRQRDAAGS